MSDIEYNVVTQFVCKKNAKDIPIHLYTLVVKDFESRHEEYGSASYELRRKNDNDVIVFAENSIASFEPITDLCGLDATDHEERVINISNERERTLLERLIKRELFEFADSAKYDRVGNDCLHIKRPVFSDSTVVIYKKITVECNVDTSGRILVAVGLSHDFERAITLDRDIAQGNIRAGDEVKDIIHGIGYNFQKVADFTISDTNDFMGQSIIDYYKKKGEDYIVKGLPADTHPVLVLTKNRRGKKSETFPYIANRLRRVVRIDNIPLKAKNIFKLTPDQKMKEIVENMVKISYSAPHTRSGENKKEHAIAIKNSMICENQGFSVKDYPPPYLIFAGGQTLRAGYGNINNAMKTIGPYKKYDNKIEIRYFIDGAILTGENATMNRLKLKALVASIEGQAKRNGVNIERVGNDNEGFFTLNMDSENEFGIFLRQQVDKGVFKSPAIFLLGEKHLATNYKNIKKILGGLGGVTSQCVNFDKVSNTDGAARDAYITNILLGIYAKSGIQSWALRDALYSDCFVGIDVSRENGVNKGAFVQVIGRDGVIVSTKVVSASLSGEAIPCETMKDIILDAIAKFQNYYGQKPRHITFHRDGRCFESLDAISEVAKEQNILFDYVEITKTFCIRMATFGPEKSYKGYGTHYGDIDSSEDNSNFTWHTEFGRSYIARREAYLTTTNPKERIGMAIPIKIKQITCNLEIEKIVSDVWNLSFMHVHSLPKTRLPVTTYYADLCSTYGVRDWIPQETNDVLFFV